MEPQPAEKLFGPEPAIELAGAHAEAYLDGVSRLVAAGRLNKFYPDPFKLQGLFDAMKPSVNGGLYNDLQVSLRHGLPVEKAVTRIMADYALTDKVLREATRDELLQHAAANPSEAARRRVVRYDYSTRLKAAPPPPHNQLDLALRRVDPSTKTAYFTVIFDRYDLAAGMFVRYTILLSQTDSRWTRQQVELVGDDLKYTVNFRNVIERFTADEAQFAFILLSDLRNIQVEEVIRGRVGPLYFRGVKMPPEFVPLFDMNPYGYIMHFPLERCGRTVARDGNMDPLSILYREYLTPEAREPVEKRAQELGYRVWKERKFATTPDLTNPLHELLSPRGFRCLIQSI